MDSPTAVLTFVSDADRDAYLVHPDHKGIESSWSRSGMCS